MTYDPDERRATPLGVILAREIASAGPMPLAAYMRRCLWDERHGYYATRLPLGRSGDFVTAPEISQTFGELIGLWSAVVWRDVMHRPPAFTLAELGPGRGTLISDALRATRKVPGFEAALRCHLIEASPPLIEEQRKLMATAGVAVRWSADPGDLDRPAIVIANEFVDAQPIEQWVYHRDGWRRRCVGLDEAGRLTYVDTAGGTGQDLPAADVGTVIERHDYDSLFAGLTRRAGALAMLLIDYGHARSSSGDSLQAVRRHRYEHPLTSPGEADVSVQVDFAALAAAARRSGFATDGPTSQGAFLGALGIVERAHALMAANAASAHAIEVAVARLIAPEGMGSRFKVLAVRTPDLAPLPGFAAARPTTETAT